MKNSNISKNKSANSSNSISQKDTYGAYKIFFNTLVSESRLRIINALRKDEMNVTELTKLLGADQSAVSHDLARLRNCGFVKTSLRNKFRYYSLNEETIRPLMAIIDRHMANFCIHILHGKGEEHHGR